jgi:cell division septation protein DedD
MSSTQDTEITLGTGKLLLLFFGLVALCAVFFSVGYNFGRSSSASAVATERAAPAVPSKRSQGSNPTDAGAKSSDLSFYKTVEQSDSNPQLTPAQAQTSTPPSTPADSNGTKPSATSSDAPDPTTIPSSNAYYVQVAAVSKQDDAEALVDALKKKQYPAFTANNSSTDKLFHVQVGPYTDVKDAEIMRAKLISDGYNPILKK